MGRFRVPALRSPGHAIKLPTSRRCAQNERKRQTRSAGGRGKATHARRGCGSFAVAGFFGGLRAVQLPPFPFCGPSLFFVDAGSPDLSFMPRQPRKFARRRLAARKTSGRLCLSLLLRLRLPLYFFLFLFPAVLASTLACFFLNLFLVFSFLLLDVPMRRCRSSASSALLKFSVYSKTR